jgi:DNA-binding response OmpR family regulator
MASDSQTGRWLLVVEDDEDLLRMLSVMLRTLGRVQTAQDGQEALDQLHGSSLPAVVVTDLMMPRVDGLSLARQMKNDAKLAHVPIVMLTARGRPRDIVAGINAGARHYVTKPFKKEELLEKVKRAIGEK